MATTNLDRHIARMEAALPLRHAVNAMAGRFGFTAMKLGFASANARNTEDALQRAYDRQYRALLRLTRALYGLAEATDADFRKLATAHRKAGHRDA
jgi:hypothetical protein